MYNVSHKLTHLGSFTLCIETDWTNRQWKDSIISFTHYTLFRENYLIRRILLTRACQNSAQGLHAALEKVPAATKHLNSFSNVI